MAKRPQPANPKRVYKLEQPEIDVIKWYLAARLTEVEETRLALYTRANDSGLESYYRQSEGLAPVSSALLQWLKRDDRKLRLEDIDTGLAAIENHRLLMRFRHQTGFGGE